MKKKLISLVIVIAVLATVFAGCGKQSSKKNAEDKKTLTVALSTAPVTLNPLTAADNNSWTIVNALYDQLFVGEETTLDGQSYVDKGKVKGDIIKDYKISDDNLQYTLTLNDSAKFSNGDAVNSDALLYSIEALKGSFLYQQMRVATTEKVDDLSVKVTLTQVNPDFLSCATNISLIDPKQVESNGANWLDTNSAGTGPYKLDKWDPSSEIIISANPNYYKGTPAFEKIVFKIIPESSNQTLLLNKGDIDISTTIASKDLSTLSNNAALSVLTGPSNKMAYLAMNSDVTPFNNPLVRQAVSYAIPYDSLIKDVKQGMANKLVSVIPSALDTALTDGSGTLYSYNLDKAKDLLKQAGYESGLSFDFLLPAGYQDYEDSATLIQSELAKIGVKMNITKVEYSAFLEALKSNAPAAFINAWTPYVPSPVYHIDSLFKSTGMFNRYTHYKNADVDTLLESAKKDAITDKVKFKEEMATIQKQIAKDAPWAYLYEYKASAVMNKNLKGYHFYSDEVIRVKDLSWK